MWKTVRRCRVFKYNARVSPLLVITCLFFWLMGVGAQDFTPPLMGEFLAHSTHDAIHLYDTSTGITRQLVFEQATHHIWDFSPDGCFLLFSLTDNASATRLFSARLDGSAMQSLLDLSDLPDGNWRVWDADWSPTEPQIAFTLTRDTDEGVLSRVAWIPATGGKPVFYSVAGDEHSPRWSPDGDWLAYVSYEQRPAGAGIFATAAPNAAPTAPRLREADLWMISANGLTKERLTWFDVGSATHPRWSPDSNLLSFLYSPGAGENQFWMIAAVAEAIPTQLSFEWNQTLDVVWHPDGTSMVAAVRNFGGVDESRLWSIPLVGNADTDATLFLPPNLSNMPADFPRFNASGTKIAFRSTYQLVIMDTMTNELTSLESVANTPPIWSPEGFVGESNCDN